MDIYKITQLKNGDLLFQLTEIGDELFNIIHQENGDILFKLLSYINITDIKDIEKYNFSKSNIIECKINNQKHNKLKYKPILGEIYNLIGDGTKIIKNTTLNIKTIKKNDKGFCYLSNLGISVQSVDSNKCLLEIIHQCVENNIKLSIKLKLNNTLLLNIEF